MKTTMLAAAALALLTTTAIADEVWTSGLGDIVYEAEIDGVAIFTYPLADGTVGRLYFPGLAGNYDQRATHTGYWIAPGVDNCGAELTGVDGTKSKDWGQLLITFHSPSYPTGWTLINGSCFGPLNSAAIGMPKVEESVEAPEPPEAPEAPEAGEQEMTEEGADAPEAPTSP